MTFSTLGFIANLRTLAFDSGDSAPYNRDLPLQSNSSILLASDMNNMANGSGSN